MPWSFSWDIQRTKSSIYMTRSVTMKFSIKDFFSKYGQIGVWPTSIYLFKVNNGSTRTIQEIWYEVNNKIREQCQWRPSGVFLLTLNISLMIQRLTLNKYRLNMLDIGEMIKLFSWYWTNISITIAKFITKLQRLYIYDIVMGRTLLPYLLCREASRKLVDHLPVVNFLLVNMD